MTFIFLIAVLFVVPYLSYKSKDQIHLVEALDIPRQKLYFQSLVMQGILSVLAFFALRSSLVKINYLSTFSPESIGVAVGIIVLAWVLSGIRLKNEQGDTENSLRYILPRNGKEQAYWLGTTFISSFMEEYIYRGVLFLIFFQTFEHNWWLAALASAVVFGFSHATQGITSILFIIPFGLAFQFLFKLSGGLLLPVITHFIYNTGVNLFFSRQILNQKKQDPPEQDPY
jgi:membrane protease YdiL (CAAX protease family)